MLLVSTGSGHKLDEAFTQPFISRAANVVVRHKSALYYCKRIDRSGREDYGLAPLVMALRGKYVCDENGLGVMDDGRSLQWFISGSGARKTAQGLPKTVRAGQRNQTGVKMMEGQVEFHLASPPPPGFGVAGLKGATSIKQRILFLDTAACRPLEADVAYGWSAVVDSEGELVDQVENVRFLLRHIGLPGWNYPRLAQELSLRRFSTYHYRSMHGPDAYLDGTKEIGVMVRTVLSNLDVYETGTLRRALGSGVEPIEITGCLPPDGPWATAEARRPVSRETDKRGSCPSRSECRTPCPQHLRRSTHHPNHHRHTGKPGHTRPRNRACAR